MTVTVARAVKISYCFPLLLIVKRPTIHSPPSPALLMDKDENQKMRTADSDQAKTNL